jgi:hypothetical protein
MSATLIRGTQVLNASIQRVDLDTVTPGQAVVTKIVQGTGIVLSSSGVDSGTGDVTVSALASLGTWTTLTLASGWTGAGQYKIQTDGTVSMVSCRGKITQAAGAALLAFTFPVAGQPSAVRMLMLSGMQTEGETLYHANITTTGAVTITPVVRAVFTWPVTSTAQDVYLDGLTFSL